MRFMIGSGRGVLLGVAVASLFAGSSLISATLPVRFSETLIASNLSAPTAMAFAPDGRLFVCQQTGEVRVIEKGVLLPDPFVTVDTDPSGERGLLGIAFDPQFGSNGFVYLYFTSNSFPAHNQVIRLRAKGDVAVTGPLPVLQLDDLSSATNHNGGALHFGPDGKLYIAVGENANGSNSQTLSNLLGKILRINGDGSIPTDNPFYASATGQNRAIWALGLRNPYTFAFQPGTTRMLINDVGQSAWEEINDGIAGSNYGWPITEGITSDPRFRSPLFVYDHTVGPTGGCAITGGTFYNPIRQNFAASYLGKYFFADFCSGWIRLFNPADSTVTGFASGIDSPVDLQVGPDGGLYYLARGSGQVFRIQQGEFPPPPPSPPENDNFTSAQVVAGVPGQISGSNVSAHKETGEPNHAGNAGGQSVWYSWTTPFSRPVTFDTRGSSIDTLLAVYQGTSIGGLVPVVSNDDISPSDHWSRVTFDAVAGTVYRIAVDGFGGGEGTIELRWSGLGGRTDFDIDGQGDLVWQNNSTGQRAIWLMNGTSLREGLFLQTIPTQAQIAATGDFNHDGHVDIVWENTSTGARTIWLMNGAARIAVRPLPTAATSWHIVATGDFNTDGNLDLVWQENNTGQRAIWFMNGTTRESVQYLPTVPTQWQIAGAGDFDRDGQLDLVWQNSTTGDRAIWFMHGPTRVGYAFILPRVSTQWRIAGTGEFNRDDQVDLIWQNITTGERAIWLMNGTTLGSSHYLPTLPTTWEIRNH